MSRRDDPMAGLRSYFEDLNRVAPGEQQLGLVLARTATTTQRPAWRVRLPRVTGLDSLADALPLRYGLVAMAMLLVVWTVSFAGGGSGVRSGFGGRWTSIDHDGSTQTLQVEAGPTPDVQYVDQMASGCVENRDDSFVFHAAGRGSVSGDRLVVAFPGGGCHTWQVAAYTVTFLLDRSSDTLVDGDGTTWHRAP
jgi:hypothetical protein